MQLACAQLAGTLACGAVMLAAAPPTPDACASLERNTAVRSGDLAEFARNDWPIRVLVPYGRTMFWVDPDGPQGFLPTLFGGLEQHLRCAGPGCEALRVAYVVTPVDRMQSALAEGRGEIASEGMMAISPSDRSAWLSAPIMADFDLCVAAGAGARPLGCIDDLSDRAVAMVRDPASEALAQSLDKQFAQRGLKPPQVRYADEHLSTEDLLELVGAGACEYTIAPRPLVSAWTRSIPGLVATAVSVSAGQRAACAVRKDMPQLCSALDAFLAATHASERAATFMTQGPLCAPPLQSVVGAEVEARLRLYAPLFVEYGTKYALDPVMVAAQCFQESRFDPRARSSAGAMGLMQLMPETAKELGVRDPYDPRQSVEGGCKYMDWLHRNYFGDASIPRADQRYFCQAAYNAGAGSVRKWRAQAAQRGLDANRWFGSVERIASANGAIETVNYVGRIAKYAVQFRGRLGE